MLPALTWQGLNAVDDDADGFADRLPSSRAVHVDRPFEGGGLPPRFNAEVSPLLRWLDRERLPYDLTTDLALARHEGPALGNAPGVAFAGSELWLPDELLKRLRDYVADGGRLAAFGADSFRRAVKLKGAVISDPTPRRREDALGERTKVVRTSAAPLTVFEDSLGLFEGVSGFVGDFTVFETASRLSRLGAPDDRGRPRRRPARLRRLRPRPRHGDPRRHAAVGARVERVGAQHRAASSDKAHLEAPVRRRFPMSRLSSSPP